MSTINQPPQPRGDLTLQTIAMPKDTNANGDIFGGWMLSQMDLGSAILAELRTPDRRAIRHRRMPEVVAEACRTTA